MIIDTTTEFGARVERRLREEEIIWLVTVDESGVPHPSPVWFLWDGATMLIYSRPNTPKLHNITRNPHVALHFNSDQYGGDIVTFIGHAEIIEHPTPGNEIPDYSAKYARGIERIGLNPEHFAYAYSAAVRVTPKQIRRH